MPSSNMSPLLTSVRTALGHDRVVRAALLRARDITQCRIVMLHAGIDAVQLCVVLNADDPGDRIRRATIHITGLAVREMQAHASVERFPHEPPRDLFDPRSIRSYAAVPLHAHGGIEGGLQCLDVRARPFSEEQLQDMEALSFTVSGRLVPSMAPGEVPSEGLGGRLRSLKQRLEPITDFVRTRPLLAEPWRDLGTAIEEAATELDARMGRGGPRTA